MGKRSREKMLGSTIEDRQQNPTNYKHEDTIKQEKELRKGDKLLREKERKQAILLQEEM